MTEKQKKGEEEKPLPKPKKHHLIDAVHEEEADEELKEFLLKQKT